MWLLRNLSEIAPVWYSTKMPVACIIGLETHEPFTEASKIHLDNSSESLFKKYY